MHNQQNIRGPHLVQNSTKGCLSLFNYFTDMSPTQMSPYFVKKTWFSREKYVFFFLTKNGLIWVGLMSTKQLNKKRPPLVGSLKKNIHFVFT